MQDIVDRGRRAGKLAGETNGRAKLTQKIAEEIRTRYKSGETQLALADVYGISQHAISKIVRNLRYVSNELIEPKPAQTQFVVGLKQKRKPKQPSDQLPLL